MNSVNRFTQGQLVRCVRGSMVFDCRVVEQVNQYSCSCKRDEPGSMAFVARFSELLVIKEHMLTVHDRVTFWGCECEISHVHFGVSIGWTYDLRRMSDGKLFFHIRKELVTVKKKETPMAPSLIRSKDGNYVFNPVPLLTGTKPKLILDRPIKDGLFYVWVEGTDVPTVGHATAQKAQAEAERIQKVNVDRDRNDRRPVYILGDKITSNVELSVLYKLELVEESRFVSDEVVESPRCGNCTQYVNTICRNRMERVDVNKYCRHHKPK